MPHGKTLYLGPSGRGQVHDDTLERPAFKKMVEAGDVEVLDQDQAAAVSSEGDSAKVRQSSHGLAGNRNTARKGDR